ncbi:MAG: polyprenyl synthetase family protein [Cytophagales bacterium]|nr:polyprenyl synthetase family protein [Cytophagales bacterium]MDW8385167.1 polyprenyl synthetase family protein [Flammeovirgaceae bacterium]
MSVALTDSVEALIQKITAQTANIRLADEPAELYDPIRYMLSMGGKRIRPLLGALSYQMYHYDVEKFLPVLLALEVFHNFTLMHDDIMDNASLRRGKPTVHQKWNTNIAILSGDVMLVRAYDLLLHAPTDKLPRILQRFNATATGVCEGQQWDMNYETRESVSVEEYINMIQLKTAILLGFSLELGAILADAPEEDIALLYEFGVLIGIGFQLKDDLLDVYGDSQKFGKNIGGDIVSNKKTYLLILALQEARGELLERLKYWLSVTDFDKEQKIKEVTQIYDALCIKQKTNLLIQSYFERAFSLLPCLSVSAEQYQTIESFTKMLIDRDM